MEVKHDTKHGTVIFSKVKCGSCFYAVGEDANRLFMRIPSDTQGVNAVLLTDGDLEGFDARSKVYIVEAHVVVTAIQ